MPFVTTKNWFGTGVVGAGTRPMPDPMGSEVVSIRVTAQIDGQGAIGDVVQLCKLPAGCLPIDWEIDTDLLGATMTLDFGVIIANAVSAAAADGGKWLTASAGLQAAAFIERRAQTAAVVTALARMTPGNAERALGFVVIAAGTTSAVAAIVGLKLTYRAAYTGA